MCENSFSHHCKIFNLTVVTINVVELVSVHSFIHSFKLMLDLLILILHIFQNVFVSDNDDTVTGKEKHIL